MGTRAATERNGSGKSKKIGADLGEPLHRSMALVSVRAQQAEGDGEFQRCYAELYPRITAYLFLLTRDRDAAHDLAQESFARLFVNWARVQAPGPYAYRVATNLARRRWRHHQLDLDVMKAAIREEQEAIHADPVGAIDMRDVVDDLPRRYRQLVLLHYYADLPLPMIAAALDRPLGTVKRQLAEARQMLAVALEGAR